MFKPSLAALIAFLGWNGAALAQTPTAPAQATQADAAQAAARTCALPKIADTAPLDTIAGSDLMTVPVVVNGKTKQFLLDIAVRRPTEVSPALMAELGLPENFYMGENVPQRNPFGGSGLSGVKVYDINSGLGAAALDTNVRVNSFGVGNATGRHLEMLVAKKGEIGQSAPYDGFLTGDFFHQYDVELDFARKQMAWLTPTQCTDPDQVVFWAHDEVAIVPVSLANDGRLQMRAMVGGHLINAEIDTHSARSVMRRDIAELYVGLKPDAPDMVPAGDLKDGMNMQIYVHTFPQIIFAGGGITALNVPVLIQDYSMRPALDREQGVRGALVAWNATDRIPDLVIGMDVLKHLHMYVVPGQGRVYVTAAN